MILLERNWRKAQVTGARVSSIPRSATPFGALNSFISDAVGIYFKDKV